MSATRCHIVTLSCLSCLLLSVATAAAQQAPGQTAPGQTAPAQPGWNSFQPSSAEPTDAPARRQKSVCAIGRAGEDCASIVLLELGVRGGATPVSTLDIGLLINQGEHQAFGATIGSFSVREESGWNAKLRYRRWLSEYVGFDIGVGGGRYGMMKRWSAVGEIAIELGDIIAVTAAVDSYDPYLDMGERTMAATACVPLGSYPTLLILETLTRLVGR